MEVVFLGWVAQLPVLVLFLLWMASSSNWLLAAACLSAALLSFPLFVWSPALSLYLFPAVFIALNATVLHARPSDRVVRTSAIVIICFSATVLLTEIAAATVASVRSVWTELPGAVMLSVFPLIVAATTGFCLLMRFHRSIREGKNV